MNAERLLSLIQDESRHTTSASQKLLESLRDFEYRREFVAERVRSSMAIQVRELREKRDMTQSELGAKLGKTQAWVSQLENPDYGKMTVSTLLKLANAFDTDLEIKFRPFSTTIEALPKQGPEYFIVPSFTEEYGDPKESEATGEGSIPGYARCLIQPSHGQEAAFATEALSLARKGMGAAIEVRQDYLCGLQKSN